MDCDIAVIGGGLGGIAAAVTAARAGYRVCLTEETQWLGGQVTSQGLATLSEHEYIEHFGGTALYGEFRNRIRSFYKQHYQAAPDVDSDDPSLNPGAGWMNRLCFEPRAALSAILDMTIPLIQEGRLQIHYGATPHAVERVGDHLDQVILRQPAYARLLQVHAAYYLDATELGDLLPLCDIPYITGAEARDQTGEPHARPQGAAPLLSQAFCIPFAVERCAGGDHTIPQPPEYTRHQLEQPFALSLPTAAEDLPCPLFAVAPGQPGSFWTHHRILAANRFTGGLFSGDLATISCPANDYTKEDIIDCTPRQRSARLQDARQRSLGLLHWIQTRLPRDDGQGCGYPEIRLRGDVLGSVDGLAQFPHVRESRRICAEFTVREQDVSTRYQAGARATFFADSVGVGWHPLSFHRRPGDIAVADTTRPFQIPLGAFLQTAVDNLLPACRNIGVTHITNACYRHQPVEWNIGESAAQLAMYCIQQRVRPVEVRVVRRHLRALQRTLLTAGVPLFWYVDLAKDREVEANAQFLTLDGVWMPDDTSLVFAPHALVTSEERAALLASAHLDSSQVDTEVRTRAQWVHALSQRIPGGGPRHPGDP